MLCPLHTRWRVSLHGLDTIGERLDFTEPRSLDPGGALVVRLVRLHMQANTIAPIHHIQNGNK
jgi:hypothetical protein